MSSQENAKPALGTGSGATITIQKNREGLAIGLEFHGENLEEHEKAAMHALAMAGVDAIGNWIRERYNVRHEEVLRGKGFESKKSTTH